MRTMCAFSLDFAAMLHQLCINFAQHFDRELVFLSLLAVDVFVHRTLL